jgi:hypothetical protein
MNMFGVQLFDDMTKFKTPFHGAIYDDQKNLYHLLSSSGAISVWGNHLDITPYGLFMYHYGIQGKVNEDIREAYPLIFKTKAEAEQDQAG